MIRSSEYAAEQEQRDNESGMDDCEAWHEENKGKFQCPYCGSVFNELTLCCGEVHGEEIK